MIEIKLLKRVFLLFFFLGWILINFGCGKKTSPKPVIERHSALEKIDDFFAFYRGDSLFFQWRLKPETLEKMDFFKITGTEDFSECFYCKERDLESIIIPFAEFYKGNENKTHFTIQGKKNDNWISVLVKNRSEFNLSLRNNIFQNKRFFYLRYGDEKGKISTKSKIIKTYRPIDRTPPKFKFTVINKRVEARNIAELLIQWKSVKEVVKHRLDTTEKIRFKEQAIGVNLYYSDINYLIKKINKKPIISGQFLLSLDKSMKSVFGRYIDRFGNESAISNTFIFDKPEQH